MRKSHLFMVCGAILIVAGVAFGQEPSLGDVARQQRSKQKSKPANGPTKVLSNEDMPKHVDADEGNNDSKADSEVKDEHASDQDSGGSSHSAEGASAEQWKAQILVQKRSIAAQQEQVERYRASIHFVEANRYVNGVQYNEQQRRKQIQLDQMEKQLEQQKKRLSDMQESARRAGFGNSVYDPND